MTMIQFEAILTRYGLKTFPFATVELDPTAHSSRAEWFSEEVDGCRRISLIKQEIEDSQAAGSKTPFFLVVGPEVCGRTTVANYIIASYFDNVIPRPVRIFVPNAQFDNFD